MSIDLATQFGSLLLKSPILAGACPLTAQQPMLVSIEAAGAGGAVLPSLFEEQVIEWNVQNGVPVSSRDREVLAASCGKHEMAFCDSADEYLEIVSRLSESVSMPLIASLNGYTASTWVDFAGKLEMAGAAAVEMNLHHPMPFEKAGPREVEDAVVAGVVRVNDSLSIPLFIKLGQRFTNLGHLAQRLLSGTQGLVLFGREPVVDICLDDIKASPSWGLTQAGSVIQELVSIMRTHGYCPAMPLAASGGIGSSCDVAKALLAGADVAMVTSAIYREGPDIIRSMTDGLVNFMERHHMRSISDLYGQRPLDFGSDEQRNQYIKALSTRFETTPAEIGLGAKHCDQWGHPTGN